MYFSEAINGVEIVVLDMFGGNAVYLDYRSTFRFKNQSHFSDKGYKYRMGELITFFYTVLLLFLRIGLVAAQ